MSIECLSVPPSRRAVAFISPSSLEQLRILLVGKAGHRIDGVGGPIEVREHGVVAQQPRVLQRAHAPLRPSLLGVGCRPGPPPPSGASLWSPLPPPVPRPPGGGRARPPPRTAPPGSG